MSTQNMFYCPTCERDTLPATIIETPTDAQRRGATLYDQAPWVLIDGSKKKKCVNRALFDEFHTNIPRWYCGLCSERGLMPVDVKIDAEQIFHRYDKGRRCLSAITNDPMVAVVVAAAIFQKEGRRGGNVIRVLVPTANHSFWVQFVSAFFPEEGETDVQVLSKEKNDDIARLLKDIHTSSTTGLGKSIVVINVEFLTGPMKHQVELSLLQYIRRKSPDVVLLHLGRTIDESTVIPYLETMGIFDAIPQTTTHDHDLRKRQEITVDTTKDTATIISQVKSAYLPPPIVGNKRTKKSTNIAKFSKGLLDAAFHSGLIANNTHSYFDNTEADTDTVDGLKKWLMCSIFPNEERRGIAEIFGSVSSNEPRHLSHRLVPRVDHVITQDQIPDLRGEVLEYLEHTEEDRFGDLQESIKAKIKQILERMPVPSTTVNTLKTVITEHQGISHQIACEFFSKAIVAYMREKIEAWEKNPEDSSSPLFVLPCCKNSSKAIQETLSETFGNRLDSYISNQTNHLQILEKVRQARDQRAQIILSNTSKATHTNQTRSWSSINNGNLHLLLVPKTEEEARCEIASSSDPSDRYGTRIVLFNIWDGKSYVDKPHLLKSLVKKFEGGIYIANGTGVKKLSAASRVPSIVLDGLKLVDEC